MFTHFIAYDSGTAKKQMQFFLKDVLIQLLTPEEKTTFINTIIDRFLASPNDNISQKSIVHALLSIEVSANELMMYLKKGLAINDGEQTSSQLKENPITMMYAIMYMTEKLFSTLSVDPGFKVTPLKDKKAMLSAKGVTDKKLLKAVKFAEDYAEDATEPKETSAMTQKLDSKSFKEDASDIKEPAVLDYDTVFEIFTQISIFVCQNAQKFFSRDEQVSLLMLACQNIKYLGRVVSMNVISKQLQNPKATELILVTGMLLNESELLNLNYLEAIQKRVKEQKLLCRKMVNPNKE